ncbi:MAG: hypothetical protein ACYCT0_07675, partial [Sulfobacillus sp.]
MSIERQERGNLRHNIRVSILNGGFAMISTGIIGTFVPLYLLDALHGSNQQVALLNSLPAIVSVIASLAGLVIIPHLTHFKPFTFINILATRLSYLLLGLIPWISLPWSPTLTLDI